MAGDVVVIKAWGRAQHGMPLCSEILQLVAKLDGAGAELDGPTPNLDGCATAGGGSGCATAGEGRAREWMGVKRVVGSCRIGIFSYLVHGKGWVSEVEMVSAAHWQGQSRVPLAKDLPHIPAGCRLAPFCH